jgi:hypothetical protein
MSAVLLGLPRLVAAAKPQLRTIRVVRQTAQKGPFCNRQRKYTVDECRDLRMTLDTMNQVLELC